MTKAMEMYDQLLREGQRMAEHVVLVNTILGILGLAVFVGMFVLLFRATFFWVGSSQHSN